MKYLSLFSGIGGFELGIQQAYVEIFNGGTHRRIKTNSQTEHEKRQGLQPVQGETNKNQRGENKPDASNIEDAGTPTCIGYSEIDKYATQIYSKHFNHTNYGDITRIVADDLPDFDMLVGGFPCQAFSIAGKRRGFADTRGTLFFDIARILKVKRPRLLLLENVKGLLSHDNGNTFKTIIATLTELGYDLQWQVLNSKNFGVPQNRERVFIVGHLRGTPRPEVFPFGSSNEVNTEQNGQRDEIAYCLQAGGDKHRGSYIRIENMNGQGFVSKNAGTLRAGASRMNNLVNGIRRLTPKECERLQGFPDNWTEGASDTQRYKCLGNAVTVNVIQAIIEKLL